MNLLASTLVTLTSLTFPLLGPGPNAGVADPETVSGEPAAPAGLAVEPAERRDRAAARTFFDAGRAAYVAADYPAAIEAFREAYRLSASPGLLFSLAQAHRGHYESADRSPDSLRLALSRYRDYLRLAPDGSNRAVAAESIAVLRTFAEAELEGFGEEDAVTRLVVSVPVEGATVRLDDAEPVPAPLNVELEPGTHRLVLDAPGYHGESREVLIPEGITVPVEVLLAEKPARLWVRGHQRGDLWIDGEAAGRVPMEDPIALPAGMHDVVVAAHGRRVYSRRIKLARDLDREVAPALPWTRQSRAGWALVGVGGVGLLTGSILAGAALGTQAKAVELDRVRREESIEAAQWHATHPQLVRQRDSLRTGAATAFAISATLGVSAVFLLALDRPELDASTPPDDEARPGRTDGSPAFEVSALPTREGAVISARGRF